MWKMEKPIQVFITIEIFMVISFGINLVWKKKNVPIFKEWRTRLPIRNFNRSRFESAKSEFQVKF